MTSNPGHTFLDRMIALVEGAERQKTPNEIALNILLAGLTIIFLLAVVTLQPFAIYSNAPQTIFVLVSLLVCLIPTTIGGLLSAIGIAGMDRLVQRNVLAMSGRAVEAAGDVNTLLLDKTGTDHVRQSPGYRVPAAAGRHRRSARRRRAALVARRRDAGRPIDRRARQGEIRDSRSRDGRTGRDVRPVHGADAHVGHRLRRARDSQGRRRRDRQSVQAKGGTPPPELKTIVDRIARSGGTRLSSRRTAARSVSCISKTSSRAESASASRNCGRWASRPS